MNRIVLVFLALLAAIPAAASDSSVRAAVERHALANGIPAKLALGIVQAESRFNPRASNGPYTGLTQIHPRTAAGMGYRGNRAGLYDVETNLHFGIKYLAAAHRLAKGNTCGTVMRYQSGLGATRMNGANRVYCAKLTAFMRKA